MIFDEAVRKSLKMEILKNDFRFKPLRLNTIGRDFLDKYIYDKDKFPVLEGLIKTFPIEDAKKHFDRIYGIGDQFYIDEKNGVKVAYITIPNVALNIQIIEKGMEFYGYYLAASHPAPNVGENAIQLDFEPKFQDPCNDKVRKQKFLFHITPTNNVDKIMKMGLCPKSKNSKTYFPERVYVLSEYILEKEIEFLALELKRYHDEKTTENGYSLLTIDVNKIPDNVNFRIDGNAEGGFWTYDVIPPNCIVDIKKINLKL